VISTSNEMSHSDLGTLEIWCMPQIRAKHKFAS
jgi:hypothetical protein